MLHEYALLLVDLISDWGYLGIFIMMAIESSFIPFPSEVVLIPAGYLASQGEMSLWLIFFSALLGSLVGAFVNYFLAFTLGRAFLLRFGKYFFIKEQTLLKMEQFFDAHGHISTFSGRLVPGVRQLISIPAGLAKMNLAPFTLFSALGAGAWALVLIFLGYFLGENQELINNYLREITLGVLALLSFILVVYFKRKKTKES